MGVGFQTGQQAAFGRPELNPPACAKALLWCDNEWGFANRMLNTAGRMGSGG